jgi:ABC-type Na+ efflux pump permease subunit
MLRRIAAVIRREYLEHVRTKAFWISTLVVPLLMGALLIVPVWLSARWSTCPDTSSLRSTPR